MESSDVLVVGGGPVGVLNALGLARAGISVRLLEAEPTVVQKRLEDDLQRFRRMAADERLQVENFLGTKRLETPSLVRSAGD